MPPASVFRTTSISRPYFPAVLFLSQRFYSTRIIIDRERQYPRIYGKWKDTPPVPISQDPDCEEANQALGWFSPVPEAPSDPYERSILPRFPISEHKKVCLPLREDPPPPAPRRPPIQYKDYMIRPPGPRRPIKPLDLDIKLFKTQPDGKEIRRAAVRATRLLMDTAVAEEWLDFNGHYERFLDRLAEWEELTGTKRHPHMPCPVDPPKTVPHRDIRVLDDRWKVVREEARRYQLKVYSQ